MDVIDTKQGSFFKRHDWFAFWAALIISLSVYCYTLPPSVTLEDSGELAVAGDYLGVPHPPGYPSWSMLAYLFARIFSFVTFRGMPNPAWSIALLSAVVGALSAAFTALLISRSASELLKLSKKITENLEEKTEQIICAISGISCSLLFAFSPVMWSQSVIVEVYSLNAFFLILIFLLTYYWMHRPTNAVLFLTAFLFGLGLTNYQALLLAALALLVAIMVADLKLFRDFTIIAIMFVVTIGITKIANMAPVPGIPAHPLIPDLPLCRMPIEKYITCFFLMAATLAASAVGMIQHRRGGAFPSIPAGIVFFSGLVLILIVMGIEPPPPVPLQPGQVEFSWLAPTLGFLAAMAALGILCGTIPGGAFLAAGFIILQIAFGLMLQKGVLFGIIGAGPYSWWFKVYVALDIIYMLMALFLLPKGRAVAGAFLFTQLGLAFYIYMPIVSDLRNPPMNWGYPRTWEGFLHAITRGQYEQIVPTPLFSLQFVNQIGSYFSDLREQFTLPVATLGFLPFTIWRIKFREWTINAFNIAIVLCIAATGIIIAEEILVPAGEAPMANLYKGLIALIMLLMIVGISILAINQIRELWHMIKGSRTAEISEKATAMLILAGCALIYMAYSAKLLTIIGEVTLPMRTNPELPPAELYSIIIKCIGMAVLIAAPAAITIGVGWLMRSEHELQLTIDDRSQNWFAATFTGFLCMSVLFVWLASPKGDLQDAFIQKVKFISSHGLYAFWIGYGMVLTLSYIFLKVKNNTTLKVLALSAIIALPLIPIYQNYYDPIILKKYGGAEQNQHDFGWQFGNYQLRGADAITEELEEKEEPLPNPAFPQEMGPAAVFYGGTDPGRFVPTYMIYSAQVRPDVHLITQNALADNTYMSVMRDLYGDNIWIPAASDSAVGFQRYIDEVNSGKRPKNADLKFENGRLQVSGALGVMEINGILAQMIFEHNNYKHDFFIEESYVLQWMFPYLTPHGLIMKINKNPLPMLTPDIVNDDMDFWDWYTRSLVSQKTFCRDVCARKSFSKLRSAIAGVYSYRTMLAEAERAFHHSRLLYPLSPEANFRLSQEIYLRQNRFADIKNVMGDFAKEDPGNRSVNGFLDNISRVENMSARMVQLESMIPQGKLDANMAIELASLYQQSGNSAKFANIAQNILTITNLPPHFYFQIAQLLSNSQMKDEMTKALSMCMDKLPEGTPPMVYIEAARMYAMSRQMDNAAKMLSKYLTINPSDWKAWLDAATLYMEAGNTNLAMKAVDSAIRYGGNNVMSIISKEPRFQALHQKMTNPTGQPQKPRSRVIGY